MLGRQEAGVVVAVQGLLPVGDEGSTLKKRNNCQSLSHILSAARKLLTSLIYAPESGASSRSLYAVSLMSEVTASATSDETSVG